jgi:hypothetical protein
LSADQYTRFKHLTYEGFRDLAADASLTPYEKIGFPDSYRAGKEAEIFADIRRKLPSLEKHRQVVLDIGPGCTDVPRMMVDLCAANDHTLLLVDAPEMLSLIPDAPHVHKQAGRFPDDCTGLIAENAGRIDVLVTYSVFHYVYAEGNVFRFVDECIRLLAEGGAMLIGDIPNVAKRKRFFASPAGVRFHQQFMKTNDVPSVTFNCPEPGEIDDAVLLALIMRVRSSGCDAYILPQPPDLPMANRREDLLICKP